MTEYEHFRGKRYVAQGEGIFRPVNGDPIIDIAFDADDVSRRVYVYLGKEGYVLEDASEKMHPQGLVCVVYRAQYNDAALGERPLFVRSKKEFFAQVNQEGYCGPRFILQQKVPNLIARF
ncbi:MAG TPA: DUF1653 domain-containing protein [Candidatus Nanoarchaeia archaeon]|nr:DUF1653 domain-containing protein [Candidatus Nanoarchaeia archaeon]